MLKTIRRETAVVQEAQIWMRYLEGHSYASISISHVEECLTPLYEILSSAESIQVILPLNQSLDLGKSGKHQIAMTKPSYAMPLRA